MLLIDTNVLIDIFEDDQHWYAWSSKNLRSQARIRQLAIDPVVYAELAATFASPQQIDARLAKLRIELVQPPRAALFLAGKAFIVYRQRGGLKTSVLADFLIGAHAAVRGCAVLTRDARRFRDYFPTVELITPESEK